ncbi:anti-repressor SinI family protein [Cytobacillus gottheilii]|uniref:Anti-repressor SinI family protein n=1 Tax=Cytobacillus gottheilii TaxID=859144 RepID=A0ABX8FG30_9BACI|nr:anti-repressor SinI family protein [Cytobacillus gottheilii]QVY62978.1 anti-repressor SinI family protein [Cytobacillus gottheilii]
MDDEWMALMYEAISLGLTPEEVRKWIEENNEGSTAEGVQ